MSASDLAPFVAAVIEDGIVAEMKNKIEELESKIQRREENHLQVQITGRGGSPIYFETSLQEGRPVLGSGSFDLWCIDPDDCTNPCIFPFDEESAAQLEIRVGGFVLLRRFWSHTGLEFKRYKQRIKHDDIEPFALAFSIGPSEYDHNKTPVRTIHARLGLAASSSTSMDDKNTFVSLIKSFQEIQERVFRLNQLLRHFGTLINTNDERGGGTKLAMI